MRLLLLLALLLRASARPLSHCSSLHGPFCPLLNNRALPTHARALLGLRPSAPLRAPLPGVASALAELARAVAAAIAAAAALPGSTAQRTFCFDFGDSVIVDVALVSYASDRAPDARAARARARAARARARAAVVRRRRMRS